MNCLLELNAQSLVAMIEDVKFEGIIAFENS